MGSKIINSYTSEKSGFSRVTIQNKYGKFTGYSFCHPDDMKTFSCYAGERYAEIRANIRYIKKRYQQEKLKLKTIQNLMKDIETVCSEEDKNNNPVLKRIKLKLRDYTQSVEDYGNLYEYLVNSVKRLDKERQEFLLKYNVKDKARDKKD